MVQVGIDVYITHRKYEVKLHYAAIVQINPFFCLHQENKSSESIEKFRQASYHCKSVLTAVKLVYGNKTKESLISQKLGSWLFWRIPNSVTNKANSAILPLFNSPEVLSSASDKVKLHNISVTPKMVKKVVTNLDSSKASGPDGIPVVVLKNCELNSGTLAELFNMCQKETCLLDC